MRKGKKLNEDERNDVEKGERKKNIDVAEEKNTPLYFSLPLQLTGHDVLLSSFLSYLYHCLNISGLLYS